MDTDVKCVRVGLLGAGVVGGGVVEMIAKYNAMYREQLGIEFSVTRACVKSPDKARDFTFPESCHITTDPLEVVRAKDVDVVVEVMGGTTLALDAVLEALAYEKAVVTANKAMLSAHLGAIAGAARDAGTQLAFEAAVCGGIPVIKTMQRDLMADRIQDVFGIINGTTNYILSRMEDEGSQYGSVLADAQRLGYAEADPTADVGGADARSKIILLAALAFGCTVSEGDVYMRGVDRVSSLDFDVLRARGRTLRLAGAARRVGERGVCVFVSPVAVEGSHPLASVKGPTNMVHIKAECVGDVVISGPGAGRYPTATSVMSDLIAVARNQCETPFPRGLTGSGLDIQSSFESKFYFRVNVVADERRAEAVEMFRQAGVAIETTFNNTVQAPGLDLGVPGAEMRLPPTVLAGSTAVVGLEALNQLETLLVQSGLASDKGDILFAPLL